MPRKTLQTSRGKPLRWTIIIDDADPPTTVEISCHPDDHEATHRWLARLLRNRMIPAKDQT